MQFVDRLALHHGRLLITPVDPAMAPFLADTKWADEPINEGTPLNAETFQGVCEIITGTYKGTGTLATIDNPVRLVCPFAPMVLFLTFPGASSPMIASRNADGKGWGNASSGRVYWDDSSFSLVDPSSGTYYNRSDYTYHYAIIGE